MKDSTYRSPNAIAILLGIAAFLALLFFVIALGSVTKSVGHALLLIPERLGLIETVHRNEVQTYDLRTLPSGIHLPVSGLYAVYTNDYDLLVISDEIARANTNAWINVSDPGELPLEITPVARGLQPYDSPFAPGRPVYTFMVRQPGDYHFSGPRRPADISILPDRTTGHEGLIWFYYLVQVSILAAVPIFLFNRRRVQQSQRVREVQGLKHIRGDVISQLRKPKNRSDL